MNQKMKNQLLIVFALFVYTTGYAQNWMPINRSQTNNYGIENNNIKISIRIDSLEIINYDTTFYLNKICKHVSYDILLINQPTFLLSQFTKNIDSITFLNSITNNTYKLLLNDTSAFLFDSTDNITAQCISKSTMNLFDSVTDSIYIFLLSTDDSIILSKNHGIIKFPMFQNHVHYLLLGIENVIGTQMPMFYDFFDFSNGDTFEYLIQIDDRYWWHKSTEIRKIQINQKTLSGDSLIYLCNIKSRKIYYNYDYVLDTSCTSKTGTLCFVNQNNSFINRYPEDLFHISEQLVTDVFANYDTTYQCYIKNFGGTYLFFQTEDTLYFYPNFWSFPSNFQEVDPHSFENYDRAQLGYLYGVGLGLLIKSYLTFEMMDWYAYSLKLTAAKTSAKTFGTFSDDQIYTYGFHDPLLSETLIYPNPVTDNLIIENKAYPYTSILLIFNINGQELIKQNLIESKTRINLSMLKSGVYFLKLITGNKIITLKLIKK
jgi:hypothetical protein